MKRHVMTVLTVGLIGCGLQPPGEEVDVAATGVVEFAITAGDDLGDGVGSCDLTSYSPTIFTYVNFNVTPGTNLNRCKPNGTCVLKGWQFTPATGTNLPAIVYLHGSGDQKNVRANCNWVKYFVSRGYPVFLIWQRGIQDDTGLAEVGSVAGTGWTNAGRNMTDFTTWYQATNPGATVWEAQKQWMQNIIDDDFNDLLYTITNIHRGTAKLLNPAKIALMGHSYGGLGTTMAAQYNYYYLNNGPFKAVADLSGGGLSWSSNPTMRQDQLDAVSYRLSPAIYTRTLKEDCGSPQTNASAAEKYAVIKNLPKAQWLDDYTFSLAEAIVYGTDCNAYHSAYGRFPAPVNVWAARVKTFLNNNGM